MPSRSQLPGNIKRKKFINALVRCGFEIDVSGGMVAITKQLGQKIKNQ